MKFTLAEVLTHMGAGANCTKEQARAMLNFSLIGNNSDVVNSNINISWNERIVPVIPNFKKQVKEDMAHAVGRITETDSIIYLAEEVNVNKPVLSLGRDMAAALIRYASLNMVCLFNINDLRIFDSKVNKEVEQWATEGRLKSAAECWDAADDFMLLKIFAYSSAFSIVDKEMFCLWCANAPYYKGLVREQFSAYEKNPSTIDDLNKFVFNFGNSSHKLESEISKWLRRVMVPDWTK